jgi:hypothetical protein
MRGDSATKELFSVQDEAKNIERMVPHVEDVLRLHMSPTTPEVMQKTVKAFGEVATGKLLESPEWRYGLSIDDMIARVHDVDPELPWNKGEGRAGLEVARFLGWLTRDRRIRLGKRMLAACEAGSDGKLHYFPHVQRSRGTVGVFLITSQSRPDRVNTLSFLVDYAQMKYGVRECLGVATEPLGNGRSYDFVVGRTSPPQEVLDRLKSIEDPFSADVPL